MRRINPKPEFALQQRVEQMWGAFEYPDIDRDPLPFELAGGGGAPTIVIAAADATDISKSKADLICSGVNDHEVIQQALNQIDTGTGLGGRILLTEGTFHCAYGQIRASDLTAASPVHIQGMGKATVLSFESGAGTALDMNSEDCTVSDLHLLGNDVTGVSGIEMARSGQIVSRVKIERLGSGGAAIDITTSATNAIVSDCLIEDNSGDGISLSGVDHAVINGNTIIDSNGTAILARECTDLSITGNHADGATSAIRMTISGSAITITGNTLTSVDDTIKAEQGVQHMVIGANTIRSSSGWGVNLDNDNIEQCAIVGNDFRQCVDGAIHVAGAPQTTISSNNIHQSPLGGTNAAIHLHDPAGGAQGVDTSITDNVIFNTFNGGIEISDYRYVRISGNTLGETSEEGISLTDVSDSVVADNLIVDPDSAGNTFDGIILDGNSDRNYIHGNKIIGAVSAPQPRYGINIAASTCDCNVVVANMLGDPSTYGTDALNDAGTDTQLVYPDDATYGDNFTACGTSPSSPTSP